MQAKPLPASGQLSAYLINGAPHWLQIEADCLSWWPVLNCVNQIDETNILCNKQQIDFAQIIGIRPISIKPKGGGGDKKSIKQRMYSLGSNQSLNKSSSTISTLNDYSASGNGEKTPFSTSDLKRRLATKSSNCSRSSSSSTLSSNALDDNAAKLSSDRTNAFNKIKIYYAKQNEAKTTGRLVKVKKVCIKLIKRKGKRFKLDEEYDGNNNNSNLTKSRTTTQTKGDTRQASNKRGANNNEKNITTSESCPPLGSIKCEKLDTEPATTSINEHTASSGGRSRPSSLQTSGSAPPSCYASEGSSSRLSSCSSASPSPVENIIISDQLITPSIGQQSDSGMSQTTTSGKGGASFSKFKQQQQHHHHHHQQQQQHRQLSSSLLELYGRLECNFKVKQRGRPKRLLVFVNPFGGKGKGLHLYKSRVRRLLDLAEIEAKLIVTNYANHARDTIEDPLFNVEYFDGIICVGGDGMFSELMNGILFRYNRDKILAFELSSLNKHLSDIELIEDNDDDDDGGGRNESSAKSTRTTATTTTAAVAATQLLSSDIKSNRTERQKNQHLAALKSSLGGFGQPFKSPPIPIGVIGAGSTDCNSFGILGTNDAISATLNIILGNQISVDVGSIHSIHNDRLLRFVSTFIAYGYFGDVIRKSEKLRWLGPSRYDVTGLNTLLRNRTYNGLVRIVRSPLDGSPMDMATKCHSNCVKCVNQKQQAICSDNSDSNYLHDDNQVELLDKLEFVEQHGPFVGVNAAVMACRCPQTRKGFSPSNHLANGCADLILVRPCTRVQYVNYLLRTGYSKKSAFDLRYVDAYRCRQFEFISDNLNGVDYVHNQAADPMHSADQYIDQAKSSISSSHSCSDSPSESQQSSKSNTLEASTTTTTSSSSSSTNNKPTNNSSNRVKNSNASQLVGGGSSWNADGEILTEQSIRVKVNNRLLRVFGTGEPQPL